MQDQTRNQPDQPGERWLSVEEITVHLGVARDTVYRWIDRKGLPAHRVGKLWKWTGGFGPAAPMNLGPPVVLPAKHGGSGVDGGENRFRKRQPWSVDLH